MHFGITDELLLNVKELLLKFQYTHKNKTLNDDRIG